MVLLRQIRRGAAGLFLGVAVTCSGCASFWEDDTTFRSPVETMEVTTSEWARPGTFGNEADVRETVDIVKASGKVSLISSRAVRLPRYPLHTITTFDYAFPQVCGGHRFRVYEAGDSQILEYAYASSEGKAYMIRDYVSGPSPFIRAGLWTAYDHTGDNVSDMRVQFAKRGSGIVSGTYSQGLVTGLNATSRRRLGEAYDRALRDSHACRG